MNKKFLLIPLTFLTIGMGTSNYNNQNPNQLPSNIAYPSFQQNNYANPEYSGNSIGYYREHPASGYRYGGQHDGARDREHYRDGTHHRDGARRDGYRNGDHRRDGAHRRDGMHRDGTHHYRNREHRRERNEHRRYNHDRYNNGTHTRPAFSRERAREVAYQDLANRGITAVYSRTYGAHFDGGRHVHAISFRTLEGTGHIKYYIDSTSGEILDFEHIKGTY